jgi:hypothetical protein
MTQPQPPQPSQGSQHIRERIIRKLDTLAEDRLYQILDYVEFLESRYAQKQTAVANPLQRFAEGIEDRLRAGRVSATTIAETMGLLNRAVGVLNGVAAAGKSVATDLASAAQRMGSAVTDVASGVVSASPPGTTPGAPGTPGATGTTPAAGTAPPPGSPSASTSPPPAPPQQPPSNPPSGDVVP